MAQQATFNTSGGPVTWSFNVGNLKAAVFNAFLYDSSNVVLDTWNDLRTTDTSSDDISLESLLDKLKGATLDWSAIVVDPAGTGGPFTATVRVEQDGQVLCEDTYSGTLPAGDGKKSFATGLVLFA